MTQFNIPGGHYPPFNQKTVLVNGRQTKEDKIVRYTHPSRILEILKKYASLGLSVITTRDKTFLFESMFPQDSHKNAKDPIRLYKQLYKHDCTKKKRKKGKIDYMFHDAETTSLNEALFSPRRRNTSYTLNCTVREKIRFKTWRDRVTSLGGNSTSSKTGSNQLHLRTPPYSYFVRAHSFQFFTFASFVRFPCVLLILESIYGCVIDMANQRVGVKNNASVLRDTRDFPIDRRDDYG
ncbi:hypothetical protein WN51_06201 [Melipona quadrifasciata]|uniref:Uncharacterized protein n=1 Tax=Melipona quadrifasciata TaxID=166423 RepID=A0A0N0BCK6_9HYME|nr:hypothetical protein WN51_06201 [Melipona quadrifasciata]